MNALTLLSKDSAPAAVCWLGQMGLGARIGDTALSIDYYAFPDPDRRVPPPVPAEEVRGVRLFLGTHDHADHIDRPSWKIWIDTCPDALFVVPQACIAPLLRDGFPAERLVGMNDGGVFTCGEVTVRALAAAHEFLDRDPATGLYPCLQYVIEGCGVRIHHAGDTLRYEGMLPRLRDMGQMDLSLLPINGRDARRYRGNCIGNMTFQEAADLAGEMRPRRVMPGHWDLFEWNSADPAEFADYLDAKYGPAVPCVRPGYLEDLPL